VRDLQDYEFKHDDFEEREKDSEGEVIQILSSVDIGNSFHREERGTSLYRDIKNCWHE
jgi:hypothetical protein